MARNKTFTAAGDLQFRNHRTSALKPEGEKPSKDEFAVIDASLIVPSPFNEGLDIDDIDQYVESMKRSGLIEPISVYALPDGRYEILSGHQRFEAWCRILKNSTIKAFIIPYEKDPIARYKAHTEANVLQRDKNLRFWLSRIEQAKKVLDMVGFSGSKAEMMDKISDMLGGMSKPQIYRYESFRKLIPELQDLETRHILSANTLYAAVSLDPIQQREARKRVDELIGIKKMAVNETEAEITREEFGRIISDIKNERAGDGKKKRNREKGYNERVSKAMTSLLGTIGKCKTAEEREQAKQYIAELKLKLDEIENML